MSGPAEGQKEGVNLHMFGPMYLKGNQDGPLKSRRGEQKVVS